MITSDFVPSPSCRGPVHPRNGQGEEAGHDDSSPDEIHPVTTPVEEKPKRDQASSDCDTSSAEDVWPAELESIIGRSIISEVMHLGNGRTSTHAANDEGRVSSKGMFAALVEFIGDQEA
jgi:hypothetical protein